MFFSVFQRPAVLGVVDHLMSHASVDTDVLAGNEPSLILIYLHDYLLVPDLPFSTNIPKNPRNLIRLRGHLFGQAKITC